MSPALAEAIFAQGPTVVALQSALTAFQATGPENGGQGEAQKAAFVADWLKAAGITDITRHDCTDDRVSSGYRPNLVALLPGKTDRMLWLFGHLDVVPPGDPDAWSSDPWRVCERDGFLYGRGVEDNQQAVCSMLILAQCLRGTGALPERGLGLVFMADEEYGSARGLGWLLQQAPQLFAANDYYIVPDGGSPDAAMIEIAEKSQLWLKFTVKGKQCHASAPAHGVNSFLAASRLALALNDLNAIFSAQNPLFDPPCSTFVPTRHDSNVDAINILPGQDIFFMDCRILPEIEQASVLRRCQEICDRIAKDTGTAIEMDVVQANPASAVPETSPVIGRLETAISSVYGVKSKVCGIGGATVAALLRHAGLPAVVWACIENTCHQPDERSSIAATLKDAAVFSQLLA